MRTHLAACRWKGRHLFSPQPSVAKALVVVLGGLALNNGFLAL